MFARWSQAARYAAIIPLLAAQCEKDKFQKRSFFALNFVPHFTDITFSVQEILKDKLDYGEETGKEGERYHRIMGGYSAKSLNELSSGIVDKLPNGEISRQISRDWNDIEQEWEKHLNALRTEWMEILPLIISSYFNKNIVIVVGDTWVVDMVHKFLKGFICVD